MTYFWTIQEHVPDGLGFRLFGIAHLLWLGGIVLAVLAIALTCRRWKPETVHRLLCGLTWAALLLEICKDGVLLYTGQFRPNYLPLDLCGLSIFVEFAAVRNPRPLLLEPVYSLSLPGACLALLFPNWFSLPLWNFFSLHSFLLHGLLVLVPAVRSIFHVPDGASLLAAIIVLAIMILPSIIKVSVTALDAVPKEYEDASLALENSPPNTVSVKLNTIQNIK